MNTLLLMVLLGSSTHLSGEPGEVASTMAKLFGEPIAIGLDRAIEEPVELNYVPAVEGSVQRAVYRAFEGMGLVRDRRDGREAFRLKSYPQRYPGRSMGMRYEAAESRNVEALEVVDGQIRLKDEKTFVTMQGKELLKVFADLKVHWFLDEACFTVAFDSIAEAEFLELVALSIGARVEVDEDTQARQLIPHVPTVRSMWIGMRDDAFKVAGERAKDESRLELAQSQYALLQAKYESSVELIRSLNNKEFETLLEKPKTFVLREVREGTTSHHRAMQIVDLWSRNIRNTVPQMIEQEKATKKEMLDLIDFRKPLRATFCLLEWADVSYPTSDPTHWVGL